MFFLKNRIFFANFWNIKSFDKVNYITLNIICQYF